MWEAELISVLTYETVVSGGRASGIYSVASRSLGRWSSCYGRLVLWVSRALMQVDSSDVVSVSEIRDEYQSHLGVDSML